MKINRRKFFFIFGLVIYTHILFSQSIQSYSFAKISMGVSGSAILSFFPNDSIDSRTPTLGAFGFSTSINEGKNFKTQLNLMGYATGINYISPSYKIRNYYLSAELIESMKFTEFMRAGLGFRYSAPMYSLKITPIYKKQLINNKELFAPVIFTNLKMNSIIELSVLYGFKAINSNSSFLQIGISYWILYAYDK